LEEEEEEEKRLASGLHRGTPARRKRSYKKTLRAAR
jgi:hypothetical protein